MFFLVFIIVILSFVIVLRLFNKNKEKTLLNEIILRRNEYVKTLGSTAKIIVNDGYNFFFYDKEKQFFGIDEENTYSFLGLLFISKNDDCIMFHHKDSRKGLTVGKDVLNNSSVSLSFSSINDIYNEMMPILRKNVSRVLDFYDIVPTHQFEHDGDIIGYDTNSKKFYYNTLIHDFSDYLKIEIIDDKGRFPTYNYKIKIYIKHEDFIEDQYSEYDLYFYEKDSTFNNIVAMFKGISSYN